MNDTLKRYREYIHGLWHSYDILRESESLCTNQRGKEIYRRGCLHYKTKALVLEERIKLIRLGTL
jgi:hypothetical protein